MGYQVGLTEVSTGPPNRRSILALLEREVARTQRHGPSVSVVILDLDHFKRFNDTWGHPTGDLVLQEVARVLCASIRVGDGVGRYGGEEFMPVLPDTTSEGATILLERCRLALADTLVRGEAGSSVTISASFGVVCNERDMSLDSKKLIRMADEALYRAKERGRNRVELAA